MVSTALAQAHFEAFVRRESGRLVQGLGFGV